VKKMPEGSDERRDSYALEPSLISHPEEKAKAEVRNGLRQYDAGLGVIQEALDRGAFKLRPSLILALHRETLNAISSYAGNWRPAGVAIEKSKHTPPVSHLVPELLEDLCDYVNAREGGSNALHTAAYCMWRLNWIHPFADGNGRTSRIPSYVVLSIRAGYLLPGTPTIPYYIIENRQPYFAALDAADAACREGRIDLTMMEDLLARLLAKQLASFFPSVGGRIDLPSETHHDG
jgi:Fic family protein